MEVQVRTFPQAGRIAGGEVQSKTVFSTRGVFSVLQAKDPLAARERDEAGILHYNARSAEIAIAAAFRSFAYC